MRVALFGATGFSGRAVLSELLNQGHSVTALVRTPYKLQIAHPNLKVIQGDALDSQAIERTLEEQEAVINCLGIGGQGDGQPNSFVSYATKMIVGQMEKQGVRRFIVMSNVGAGDSLAFYPWIFRKLILPYFMKWLKVIIDDKNRMEAEIQQSRLDWTIIRCPNIVDQKATGQTIATLDGKQLKRSITNADLAVFLVEQLNDTTFLHKTPSISN